MKGKKTLYKTLTFCIALVWLINGLICKVLNLVPRHQQIVARILGDEFAPPLTKAIGCAEIAMVIWIVSGIKSRLNAIMQMIIVAVMNTIEFFAAPDLLLWGRGNAAFAVLFIIIIYINQFNLYKKPAYTA